MSTRSSIGKAVMALATFSVASAMAAMAVFATLLALPTSAATSAVRAGSPAASGPCVAVVVDFRKLGGQVQTGCAQGDPSTGLKALTLAGFSYTPRQRDGLICQINATPACTDTTTSKYWSYWYRAAGSSRWVYASQGAGSHNPKPGSTEGWVWQNGGKTPPPSTAANVICPQLAPEPSPKPTEPKPASPKPSSSASSTGGNSSAASTAKPTSPGAKSAGASPGATTSPPASPPTSSTTSGSASPTATYAASSPPSGGTASGAFPDPAKDDSGGALGGVAGVALGGAVVLGIGAATVVRGRRSRSP